MKRLDRFGDLHAPGRQSLIEHADANGARLKFPDPLLPANDLGMAFLCLGAELGDFRADGIRLCCEGIDREGQVRRVERATAGRTRLVEPLRPQAVPQPFDLVEIGSRPAQIGSRRGDDALSSLECFAVLRRQPSQVVSGQQVQPLLFELCVQFLAPVATRLGRVAARRECHALRRSLR